MSAVEPSEFTIERLKTMSSIRKKRKRKNPVQLSAWLNQQLHSSGSGETSTTSNRFAGLDDEEMESISEEEILPKEIKMPPVIVDLNHGFNFIRGLIGADFLFKRMSVGTKILSPNKDCYESLLEKLKRNNIKFYTHKIVDGSNFSMLLKGLPQLNVSEIKEDLQVTYNIEVESLKEIITRMTTADNALYVAEFSRAKVSKKKILGIKYLNGICINWRNNVSKRNGPTQCTKCAMFGHGAANCHRQQRICLLCADPRHDMSECPLKENENANFKCFNCKSKGLRSDHRANDLSCPKRKEYMQLRQNITKKMQDQKTEEMKQ